jgi:ribosomal protein S24E
MFEFKVCIQTFFKKSLKILKGKEEAVRWTDNKTAKRKKTKGQTSIYKTLHRKLKFEDTKRVRRSGISMDRQQNSQMKKDKRTNNETHNITQKTND